MSTLNLRLPYSLHNEAVAEKMSALLTEQYLLKRAKQGNEKAFLEAMSKVPDVEPDIEDKL
jgi:hypothetical protein